MLSRPGCGSRRPTGAEGLADTALLVAGAAALLLAGLGSYPLWDPDEGRHAEIARRLGSDGQWLVPRLYGEPYYDKPTGFYWLVRASFALFGTTELAARLPSVVATLATLVLLHRFAWARLGRRGAAVAAVVYATSPVVVVLGRFCNLDATLAFFVTWACLAWLVWLDGPRERPPWNAYLAMALGTLVKGPVAVLLPGLTALAVAVRRRGVRAALAGARPVHGALVIAALILPWLAGTALAEPEYVRTFFVEHNFRRYLSSEFEHVKSPLYFLWVLPMLLLPWPLLVPAVIGRATGASDEAPAAAATRADALVWAGVVVGFFSIGQAKLASYVLPAVAPLALWLGGAWARAEDVQQSRVAGALSLWGGALLAVPIGVFAWASAAYPEAASAWPAALVALPAGAAALAAGRARAAVRFAVPVLALGNAALFTSFYVAAAPAVSLVASDRALARIAARHPEVPAAGFRVQPASFSFYSQREVPRIDSTRELDARLGDGPLFVVSRRRHAAALTAAGVALYEWRDNGRHVLYGTEPPPHPDRPGPAPAAGSVVASRTALAPRREAALR